MKRNFLLLIIVFFCISCATLPKEKGIIFFDIKPDKNIKPGTIVIATVKTTENIKEVYGFLDMPGSPRVPLKYDNEKKEWVFKYMIPLTFVLPKGEFVAKVEAISITGEKSVAEKKVSTY